MDTDADIIAQWATAEKVTSEPKKQEEPDVEYAAATLRMKRRYLDEVALAAIRAEPEKYFHSPLVLEHIKKHMEQKAKSGLPNAPYIWLTVNPPEDDLEALRRAVEKAVTKKWIKGYFYVYEQRGETLEEAHGYHAHILISKGEKYPSPARTELYNSFKKLFPDEKPHYTGTFHLRFVEADVASTKMAYLQGQKTAEKQSKVLVDRAWRELHSLEPYYSGGVV